MDAFRWVLLIIGVIIFLLIFFLSKKKNQQPGQRDNEKISPVLSEPGSENVNTLAQDDSEVLDAFAQDLRAYHAMDNDDAAASQDAVKVTSDEDGSSAEKMIVLYLVEKTGGMLSGADIISSLEQAGLRYGDMKIFHYYSDLDSSTSPPVFSMANLVEPGWFDLISIDKTITTGLSLFMRLPGPLASVRAFDEMIDVISKLEHLIPVTLKDKSRNKVSKQMLSHMREEVVEFSRARTMQEKK